MDKINFNDRYGLTKAVLERRKTMTRRIIKDRLNDDPGRYTLSEWGMYGGRQYISMYDGGQFAHDIFPRYHIGQTLAVAQRGKDIYSQLQERFGKIASNTLGTPMWNNKMFAPANIMPHQIQITNIAIERLQDISDEDCIREGIMQGDFTNTWDKFYYDQWGDVPEHITFRTPREAFAALIDKVSGKGTWQKNPYIFAYTFELIK